MRALQMDEAGRITIRLSGRFNFQTHERPYIFCKFVHEMFVSRQ